MARLKQKGSQRPRTRERQARALTITPIHRGSVVQPKHIPILSHDSERLPVLLAHEMSAAGVPSAIPSRVDIYSPPNRIQAVSGRQHRRSSAAYPKFMNKFLAEPPKDAETCCLGCWVPCALYGKISWRLNEYERNRDGSDEAWNSKDGWNKMCCGLASVMILLPHLVTGKYTQHHCHLLSLEAPWLIEAHSLGTLVGCQRAQVRGTYGIDGHIATDVCLGIWCTPCVLMHSDREIRAREGVMHLRNNMPHDDVVRSQPKHREPMRYEAHRDSDNGNDHPNPLQLKRPQVMGLQKLEPKPWIEVAHYQDHEVRNLQENGVAPCRRPSKLEFYKPFPSEKDKSPKSALRKKRDTPMVVITPCQDEPQQGKITKRLPLKLYR
jgi:Cys-rich protein (TIGR01571 family)